MNGVRKFRVFWAGCMWLAEDVTSETWVRSAPSRAAALEEIVENMTGDAFEIQVEKEPVE